MSAAAQRAYVDTLSETLVGTGKGQNPMRVDDVVRKNEVYSYIYMHAQSVSQCNYVRA